jgi:2-oxoglutarate ferredoxin oxidoreductase subunit beta
MSGIGCSSKTPAYFVERAHGFNGVHGRMPSLATGAKLANRELMVLGISGDGDTASIGLGQYCHMIRRNVDCTYIIEDNGCYGLTKGQFSATADLGSVLKKGQVNEFETIDVCGLAVELGATFVARSFSGDGKQLIPLLQAAFSHRGIAVLDVISPCVTFNDHEGSTKSYKYVQEHHAVLHTADFIMGSQEVTVDYEPGTVKEVVFDNGNRVLLRKLEREYDPTSRIEALRTMHEARERGELVTGLLYVDTTTHDLCQRERLPKKPLAQMNEDELRLTRQQWSDLMESFA